MTRAEHKSFLRYPLDHVFSAGSHVKVLRWLARQRQPLAVSQLARQSGLAVQSVRNAIAALSAQGLVVTLGEGRSQVHGLRPDHPLTGMLQQLYWSERDRWLGLERKLSETLKSQAGVKAAWLYGSVARGEDSPDSDLDLVVVLDDAPGHSSAAGMDEVRDCLAEFGSNESIAVSPVVLRWSQLQDMPARSPDWWANVVRDVKVLVGPHPETALAQVPL